MEQDPQAKIQEDTKTKRALPIVFFTVFIDLLGFSIVLPILAPLLALPFGSTILPNTSYPERLIAFGWLVGSYALAQFLATPIIGQLSDRFGRKPLLAMSLIGTLVARLMFIYGILQGNIVILFVSRIVDGITGGNISVAQSAIADISTPENRVKNFGLIGASFGLGFVLGPYIGGRLGDAGLVDSINNLLHTSLFTTSTLPLWFATLLCAINVVLMLRIFPETLKEKITKPLKITTSLTNIVRAFTLGNLKIVFFTVFFFTLGFSFLTQFLSVYIGTKFQPEAVQEVKDKFDRGDIIIKTPEKILANVPDNVKEKTNQAFIKSTTYVFKTITADDLKSSDTIKYPSEIENIPVQTIREQQEQLYSASIRYVNGQVEAETQKRTADTFSYVGIWVALAQAILARQLSKKFSPATLLKFGLLILSVTIFVLLIPDKIIWLFLILPFVAISNGLIQPNSQAIISNSADRKSQGEILGINSSIQSLGQALPAIASGYLAGKLSLNSPIIVGGGFIILAFIIFNFFYKDKNKQILSEE